MQLMVKLLGVVTLLLVHVVVEAATLSSSGTGVSIGSGVCQSTKTFTQSHIYDWNVTPLELVPAPPSVAQVIRPINIHATYTPATTRYVLTSSPTLFVGTAESAYSLQIDNLFAATPDFPHVYDISFSSPGTQTLTGMVGGAVTMHNANDITVGDGNVVIVTQYYLLNSDGTFSTTGCPGVQQPPQAAVSPSPHMVNVAALAVNSSNGQPCGEGTSSSFWDCWLDNIYNSGGFLANTTYYFPAGHYNLSQGLRVSQPGVRLVGDGMDASILRYTATHAAIVSNYAAIRFFSSTCEAILPITSADPAAQCFSLAYGSIEGLRIHNNSFTGDYHVGIDLVDVQFFTVRDVKILNFQSCARNTNTHVQTNPACVFTAGEGESVGILLRGREEVLLDNVVVSYADRPVVFADDPGYLLTTAPNPTEYAGNDHTEFHAVSLFANSTVKPVIEVKSRADNIVFTGYGDWVQGCGGFHWSNANMYTYSGGIGMMGEIRWEQGIAQGTYDCTEPWAILIDVGGTNGGYTRKTAINGFYTSGNFNGLKLRNTFHLSVRDSYFELNSSRSCLNVNGTVQNTHIDNTIALGDIGNTVLTGQSTFSTTTPVSGRCLPTNVIYLGTNGG